MSLLLAIDPGASPSRPGCEAKGCNSTSTTSVRAYLGRPHATTIRVCETHRRALEVAGELENPVNCLIPECGRTRATPSRLCAEHTAIVAAAKIRIPKSGVIGTETLLAVRKAVEAEEKRQAAIAAAPPVRPQMEERAPDHMGACWRHLADLVPGGTRIDMAVEQVVADLKRTRSIQRETEERRHAADQALQAVSQELDESGAPDIDGQRVKTVADRIGALLGRWQDEIRHTICTMVPRPGHIDGGACDSGDPLDLTLAEVGQGLTQLQEQIDALKAAQPAPAVQPDPLRVQATPMDARLLAVEMALDTAGAPHLDSLVERIKALRARQDALTVELAETQARATARERQQFDDFTAIREALNVGPPSDSDVQPGTSPEELARIVRARTVCMLDERDQRVALAEEVEALKQTLGDPLAPAVDALVAWLSGPGGEQAHKGFKTGLLYALYRRAIEPMAAAEALGSLRALARLTLSTPEPFGVPF